MALDRAEVVDAAERILDTYGLADLSMRRLADSLGVKAGALYWHVANKQSLLAAVADRVLAEVAVPTPGVAPRDALVSWALDLRRVLLGHRDSAELVATALASGLSTSDPLARVEELLADGGLDAQSARWGARALLHLVLGHVVEEQNAQLFGRLAGATTALPGAAATPSEGALDDPGFGFAVRSLVAGLVPG